MIFIFVLRDTISYKASLPYFIYLLYLFSYFSSPFFFLRPNHNHRFKSPVMLYFEILSMALSITESVLFTCYIHNHKENSVSQKSLKIKGSQIICQWLHQTKNALSPASVNSSVRVIARHQQRCTVYRLGD